MPNGQGGYGQRGRGTDVAALKAKVDIVDLVQQSVTLGKKEGKLFVGLCPFHDDKNPSLKIDPTTQTFRCWSCGAAGDVIDWVRKRDNLDFKGACEKLGGDSLGTQAGPRAPRRKWWEEEPSRVFSYTDESGTELYQVLRFEAKPPEFPKKEFGQRRIVDGKVINDVNGVRLVLYHLPELKKGISERRKIFIVEGEKDVESIEAAGGVATCNPKGANSWKPEFAKDLRSAQVVIVRDKDEPGQKWADAVFASVRVHAKSTEIVEAKSGHDSSDHIAAGHKLDEFLPIRRDEGWVDMDEEEEEETEWLVQQFLPCGFLVIMAGDPGEGKSTLALAIASSLSRGKGIPGCSDHPPCHTIYLTAEDSLKRTVKKRLNMLEADQKWITAREGHLILNDEGLAMIEAKIQEKQTRLLIFDPLVAYFDSKVDIHRQNETRDVLKRLIYLAEKYNLCALGLMHLNKGQGVKANYKVIGSIDFVAAGRHALFVGHDPDDKQKKTMTVFKSNVGPKDRGIEYFIDEETGDFGWGGPSSLTADRMCEMPQPEHVREKRSAAKDWLVAFLRSNGPAEKSVVEARAKDFGISAGTLKRAREEAGISIKSRGNTSGKRGRQESWYASRGYDWSHHVWAADEQETPMAAAPVQGRWDLQKEQEEIERPDPFADGAEKEEKPDPFAD